MIMEHNTILHLTNNLFNIDMKKLLLLLAVGMGLIRNTDAQIKLPKNLGGAKTITINTFPSTTCWQLKNLH